MINLPFFLFYLPCTWHFSYPCILECLGWCLDVARAILCLCYRSVVLMRLRWYVHMSVFVWRVLFYCTVSPVVSVLLSYCCSVRRVPNRLLHVDPQMSGNLVLNYWIVPQDSHNIIMGYRKTTKGEVYKLRCRKDFPFVTTRALWQNEGYWKTMTATPCGILAKMSGACSFDTPSEFVSR